MGAMQVVLFLVIFKENMLQEFVHILDQWVTHSNTHTLNWVF